MINMVLALGNVKSSPILLPVCNVLVKALVKEANIAAQVCVLCHVLAYFNRIHKLGKHIWIVAQ